MRRRLLTIGVTFGLALLLMGAAYPRVYFKMSDPVGDDRGYGGYQYPTNIAFKPYQGLLDITGFNVWSEQDGQIYFDTSFARMSNPWMAPEGFIHQNLRIFIDYRPNEGMTVLPKPGAGVRFHPDYAWDACLRIAGWGNSEIFIFRDGELKRHSLKVSLVGENTIRAVVPVDTMGVPAGAWNYYVLVGSYDGFRDDFFRKITQNPEEWSIGGGKGAAVEPRVMDLLAPESGGHSQWNQLRSFNERRQELAELYPVGPRRNSISFWGAVLRVAGVLVLLGCGYWGYRFFKNGGNISWFWVKMKSLGETKRK